VTDFEFLRSSGLGRGTRTRLPWSSRPRTRNESGPNTVDAVRPASRMVLDCAPPPLILPAWVVACGGVMVSGAVGLLSVVVDCFLGSGPVGMGSLLWAVLGNLTNWSVQALVRRHFGRRLIAADITMTACRPKDHHDRLADIEQSLAFLIAAKTHADTIVTASPRSAHYELVDIAHSSGDGGLMSWRPKESR
jgi:hypothetical protein